MACSRDFSADTATQRSSSPGGIQSAAEARNVLRDLTLQDLVDIRKVAEELNPGVTARVSAADYESIVVAVLTKTGLPLPRRVRYTPAPSVSTELTAAISSLSRAYADVLSSSPRPAPAAKVAAKSGVVPKAAKAVRPVSPKKKTVAKLASPPSGAGTSKGATPRMSKDLPNLSEIKKRLQKKALRAFDSKSWERILSELKISRDMVKDRVSSLTDSEVLNSDTSLPALVRIGLVTLDNICERTSNWGDEVELDGEISALIQRASSIAKQSKKSVDPAVHAPQSERYPQTLRALSALNEMRAFPAVTAKLTATGHLDRCDLDRPWLIPAVTDHVFAETVLSALSRDTGVSPQDLPSRLAFNSAPLSGPSQRDSHVARARISVRGSGVGSFSYFVQLFRDPVETGNIYSRAFTRLEDVFPKGESLLRDGDKTAPLVMIDKISDVWPVKVQSEGVGNEPAQGVEKSTANKATGTTKKVTLPSSSGTGGSLLRDGVKKGKRPTSSGSSGLPKKK